MFQSCIKVNHIPPNWSFYNAAYLRCAFRRHCLLSLCISMLPQRVVDAVNPQPYPFGQECPPLENLERNGKPKKSRFRTVDKRKKLDLILVLGTRAAFCCSTRCPRAYIWVFDNDEGYVSLFLYYLPTVTSRTRLTILSPGFSLTNLVRKEKNG